MEEREELRNFLITPLIAFNEFSNHSLTNLRKHGFEYARDLINMPAEKFYKYSGIGWKTQHDVAKFYENNKEIISQCVRLMRDTESLSVNTDWLLVQNVATSVLPTLLQALNEKICGDVSPFNKKNGKRGIIIGEDEYSVQEIKAICREAVRIGLCFERAQKSYIEEHTNQ